MPANTEYLLAAYGIVGTGILVYGISLTLKLRSTMAKLKNLQNLIRNETKES